MRAVNLAPLAAQLPVRTDDAERFAHARDLWPRGTLALRQGQEPTRPAAVAWPRTPTEVHAALAWADRERVAVVPYGAGSGVCGAAAGRADALCLDLKRLTHIGPLDAHAGTVDVQAGVLGQHLEDWLEARGFATRHSPSSIWCSTVGGWAAGRSAGQFSSRYGKFEDMVRGLRVCAPGRDFGTGVWAEGQDLQDWVLGAEGALGVITDLRVRVVPVAEARVLRGWRFETVDAAWEAMRTLLQAELRPMALRLYDAVDTRVGGRLGPKRDKASDAAAEGRSVLRRIAASVDRLPAFRDHALSLPLRLPGLVNTIAGQGARGCLLVVGWEGTAAEVDADSRAGHTLLARTGTDLGAAPGESWYAHRHDVSYKLAPIFAHGGFADTMEVAALWSRLPALYAAVKAALGRHAVVMAHFSHAWREGCSIYFSFAGRGSLEVYDAAWRDALAAAASVGGTVAHHHGVGQLKMEAAARELAGVAPVFARLKAELDPHGILNPGRLFPPVDVPEPAKPLLAVDPLSQVATLDAQAPAADRDAALARDGWRLRFPTPGPLAAHVAGPVAPWECRVLGASVFVEGRRVVLLPVPRSAAGPDPRRTFPPTAYETVTVPIVPLGSPS